MRTREVPAFAIRPAIEAREIASINTGIRVLCAPEFTISDIVWNAARSWVTEAKLRNRYWHRICSACGQSLFMIRPAFTGGRYTYTEDEQLGCIVSHMIQRHQWTREGPPRG